MVEVYALCGGRLELDQTVFFPDRPPGIRYVVPIPCWLVVHPAGRLLFDTGIHRQVIADPVGRLGERRAQRFAIRSAPDDHVVAQLAALDLAPDDVTTVANSHLHFDHCGGNEFFPRATLLVQRREMEAARDPAVLGTGRYTPSAQDFDLPLPYRLVDGEHDVFGDGTVTLFPTFGHTPGHQSLRVRARDGEWVMTADACYTREHLDGERLSGVVWDAAEMMRSLAALRALRDRHGATLLFGHDGAQWAALPAGRPLARGSGL
jgi:glyoxylase-like metal-dependent hydrolase (beta-lactamase superfamily II)